MMPSKSRAIPSALHAHSDVRLRNTALFMLGTRPGMKLVVFKSLSRAAWYFVQQYMARKVGVPVVTSEGP